MVSGIAVQDAVTRVVGSHFEQLAGDISRVRKAVLITVIATGATVPKSASSVVA